MNGALSAGSVLEVARGLLGRRVVSFVDGRRVAIILTEVEAYDGAGDPASHAFRGETKRNRSMFAEAGTLYVYRSYGIHWCMNVTCGPRGVASAVLLRAGLPVEGVEIMEKRRGGRRPLASGPGNLTQALGVTGELDGNSIFTGPVHLEGAERVGGSIIASPRIGISKATDRPWRFVLTPAD